MNVKHIGQHLAQSKRLNVNYYYSTCGRLSNGPRRYQVLLMQPVTVTLYTQHTCFNRKKRKGLCRCDYRFGQGGYPRLSEQVLDTDVLILAQ